VCVAAAVLFYRADQQACIAFAGQLAGRAVWLVNKRPDLALLSPFQGFRIKDTAEARSSLLVALEHTPQLTRMGHAATNNSVCWIGSVSGLADVSCRPASRR
jgi:hypothetical protein